MRELSVLSERMPVDQQMTLDSETKRQNLFSRQMAFGWLAWSLISDQNISFESLNVFGEVR